MKKCPRCNYSNDDFNIVCTGCGSNLDEMPDPEYNYVDDPFPYPTVKTNELAVASFILGIISLALCCVILGPVALILGIIAKNQIKESGGFQKGEGMALVGIILGSIALLIFIVGWIFIKMNTAYIQNIR